MKKFARTISGVTPVAVMTGPAGCPGQCVYCPSFSETPRSYTPDSPAVIRGRSRAYRAGEQVRLRVRILADMGHPTDKIELIIMGGTFPATPVEYQYAFIKDCYDALNGVESSTLDEAKRINETAARRCTGLCIETRPDWCGPEQVERMLDFGATRVELGVQTLDDDIYRLVNRGHTVQDVADATRLLREHAFKVHYHWMPGLPGSTPEKDLALSRLLFEDDRFRPDGLKIYPTMVVEGTELEKWQAEGRYTPYPDDVMTALVADIKAMVPPYVRISRVLRDIPSNYIVGGLKDSMRDVVRILMRDRGEECRCIRCREYGHRAILRQDSGKQARAGREAGEPRLRRIDYDAAGGKEIFLSYEDDAETLFGLLRLRIQPKSVNRLGSRENSLALVRELHVYGPEVPLSEKRPETVQHRGLGKALMLEAERVAREEFGAASMAVLSGVGAREYYRSEFGYRLHSDYMVKDFIQNKTGQ